MVEGTGLDRELQDYAKKSPVFTVSVSWPSTLNATRGPLFPLQRENAAEAVPRHPTHA